MFFSVYKEKKRQIFIKKIEIKNTYTKYYKLT
jgi:hypothetical protein